MGQIYIKGLGIVPDTEENKQLLTNKSNDNVKKSKSKSNSDTTTRPSEPNKPIVLVNKTSK